MKRKEVLIALISGNIGAVIAMMMGLFTPLHGIAQSQPQDAEFGKITCREIEVIDEDGNRIIQLDSLGGGRVEVFGIGGGAEMYTTEHGGGINVYNNQGENRAAMSVNEYGNGAVFHLGQERLSPVGMPCCFCFVETFWVG